MRFPAALGLALAVAACGGADPAPPAPAGPERAPLPVARTEVAAAAWNGRVVVAGGFDARGGSVRDVDVYDPATDTWSALPPLPEGRNHAAAAVLDGRLYVSGGNDGKRPLGSVVSLGAGDSTWRPEPPLRVARSAHGMAAAGDVLVVFGGVGGSLLRSTEVLAGGAWTPGPDLGVAREHLAAAAVGTTVYAIGGRVGGLAGNLAAVETYDVDASQGSWQRGPDLAEPRGGTSAAGFAQGPCVAGGEEPGGTIGSVECLRDGAWRVVATLAEPRHGLGVAAVGETLHVVGGGPRPGLTVSGRHEALRIEGS